MSIKPEDMTLEQIKEQLALYNRLYYQRRRHEKDFMDTKRASAIRFHRRKKLDKMAENGEINLKDLIMKINQKIYRIQNPENLRRNHIKL